MTASLQCTADDLLHALEPVRTVAGKGTVDMGLDADGIHATVFDPARVALVRMDARGMDWTCETARVVGIDLPKLMGALKWFGRTALTVSHDDLTGKLRLKGEKAERTVRTVATTPGTLKVPALDSTVVEVPTEDMKWAVTGVVGEALLFTLRDDALTASWSSDTESVDMDIPVVRDGSGNKLSSGMPTSYIESIVGSIRSDTVAVGMGQDMPMTLAWTVGHVSYEAMIAPRIEREREHGVEAGRHRCPRRCAGSVHGGRRRRVGDRAGQLPRRGRVHPHQGPPGGRVQSGGGDRRPPRDHRPAGGGMRQDDFLSTLRALGGTATAREISRAFYGDDATRRLSHVTRAGLALAGYGLVAIESSPVSGCLVRNVYTLREDDRCYHRGRRPRSVSSSRTCRRCRRAS